MNQAAVREAAALAGVMATQPSNKYLTFTPGKEAYGIEILKVQEI